MIHGEGWRSPAPGVRCYVMTPEREIPASLCGDVDEVIGAIARRCPVDMAVADFRGDVLILGAGRDSSAWSDFSLVFRDVVYMALPTYLDSVTVRCGGDAAAERVRGHCNAAVEGLAIVELIEDEDWREGATTHIVAATSIEMRDGRAGEP